MTDKAKLPDGRVFRDGVEIESVGLGEKPVTTFGDAGVEHFLEWYKIIAARDATMIWGKAGEYGGMSVTAEALAVLAALPEASTEVVLAFNSVQKINRIVEALSRGQQPSVDSWRDLACYAMMARRMRETKGAWPA